MLLVFKKSTLRTSLRGASKIVLPKRAAERVLDAYDDSIRTSCESVFR